MNLRVPKPGVYGLVREDASLRLWKNRARDGTRTSWPIWSARATGNFLYHLFVVEPDQAHFQWRPVCFGDVSQEIVALRKMIDSLIWWTSPRKSNERRALYLPAMPRDALIALAVDLERRADTGVRQAHNEPIGTWIQRVWSVIDQNAKASP